MNIAVQHCFSKDDFKEYILLGSPEDAKLHIIELSK